jgi:GT2 family glycosyltransferase
MDISIIIVNFNTAKMTGECIESIYKHIHGIDFEIILVDNNSTDNSVAYLKEKFPDMELISLKENIGFGRANNCGAKKAKGKYLFLLNSDTLLFDNALFSFFNFCEKHNKTLSIGVVGGMLLNTKGEQFESFDRFPRYTSELAKLLAIHTSSDNYVKTLFEQNQECAYFPVDYVCGADMFIERKLFDEIGGFDKSFFMYFEESDMQKRLHDMGKTNYILKDIKILHYGGGSEKKTLSLKKRTIVSTSCLTYMKKHHNAISYKIFKLLFLVIETGKFCIKGNFSECKEYVSKIRLI